jgi:hypothetical protein
MALSKEKPSEQNNQEILSKYNIFLQIFGLKTFLSFRTSMMVWVDPPQKVMRVRVKFPFNSFTMLCIRKSTYNLLQISAVQCPLLY